MSVSENRKSFNHQALSPLGDSRIFNLGSEIAAERKECMSGGGEIRLHHLDSEL